MRNATLLGLVLVLALAGLAFAEEEGTPDPKRAFEEGKYVDEYFGLVYETPGLEEGFGPGLGGVSVLWSGKAEGGVSVEIAVMEGPEPREAKECQAQMKKAWEADDKERKEFEEGAEPQPWVLFVQESLAGFQRQHGYAFYARGNQCFLVHAQVREKSETSGAAIQKALQGLKVDPDKTDCFFLAHLYGNRASRSPTDPEILVVSALGTGQQGAPAYLGDLPRFRNPAFALRALELASEGLPEDERTPEFNWRLHQGIGLAQLTLKNFEDAIPTWKKCIELAAATGDPQSSATNSYYNLACGYALSGKLDEAFETLKTCYETGSTENVAELKKHSKQDPDLESMRADPRWAELVGE